MHKTLHLLLENSKKFSGDYSAATQLPALFCQLVLWAETLFIPSFWSKQVGYSCTGHSVAIPHPHTLIAIPRDYEAEFFTGRIPFLSPKQQHQSTEDYRKLHSWRILRIRRNWRMEIKQQAYVISEVCSHWFHAGGSPTNSPSVNPTWHLCWKPVGLDISFISS